MMPVGKLTWLATVGTTAAPAVRWRCSFGALGAGWSDDVDGTYEERGKRRMSVIGEVFGERYRVRRLLGRGGTADIFEAVDELTGDQVAVKVVRSNDPEFARRLVEEARALESLDGPGLVRLLDTGMVGDLAYLVMQYIDGASLAEVLKAGPLGAPATVAMAATVASALHYVHGRGVVHRDVKPSNILRSSTGEFWLADFGIAKFDDATTITAPGTTIGTVIYMAPEQLEGQRVGPRADIWSLGIVMLECLTGKRVYNGSPSEVVAKRLSGPVVLPTDLPTPWAMLLGAMLDSHPERRPSGVEVASLLETSAYTTEWGPHDDAPTQVLGGRGLTDETLVMGATSPMRAGDETLLAPPAPNDAGNRRFAIVVGAVLVAAALVYGLVSLALGGSTPSPVAPTTSTLVPSTTTTVASSATAIATLMSDLATTQAAGEISAATAQTIGQFAQQSLIDAANANRTAVESDLQQAASVIANGVASGNVTTSVGAELTRDVTNLAAALQVGAPHATVTTVPVIGPGPGNGHGKGFGKGRP